MLYKLMLYLAMIRSVADYWPKNGTVGRHIWCLDHDIHEVFDISITAR